MDFPDILSDPEDFNPEDFAPQVSRDEILLNNTWFPHRISFSSISSAFFCEQQWFNTNVLHLVADNVPSNENLTAGAAFAKAHQIARALYMEEGFPSEDAISVAIDTALDDYRKNQGVYDKKTPDNLKDALKSSFGKFPLQEELPIIRFANGSYAIEKKLEIALPEAHPISGKSLLHPELNTPIVFVVKLDLLVKDSDGFVCIFDDKTTGALPRIEGSKECDINKLRNKYQASGQFAIYAKLVDEILTLNGIQSITKGIVRVTSITAKPETYEVDFSITEEKKDSWYLAILDKLASLIQAYKDYTQTHKNALNYESRSFLHFNRGGYSSSCNDFNKLCGYSKACHSENADLTNETNTQNLIYDAAIGETLLVKDFRANIGMLFNSDGTYVGESADDRD